MMSKIIGITGSYCTGKTTVAQLFKRRGIKVFDLDKLAHKSLLPKTKNFRKIIKEFGSDILVNGKISRQRLARKVFGNRKRLAKLNSIIHPSVINEMVNLIDRSREKFKLIVVEVQLLFEVGLKEYFDYIVVVKTNRKTQLKRAIKKANLRKIDILKRINSQMPLSKKIAQADFVVDNNKPLRKTKKQVDVIINKITGG